MGRFPCCVYCGWDFEQIDHLVPHSLTGDDSPQNLVGACALCNGVAGAKVFESFEAKRGYILQQLEARFGKRVPLWTETELSEMGPSLAGHIRRKAAVCVSDAHRLHMAHYLRKMGYEPVFETSHGRRGGWGC